MLRCLVLLSILIIGRIVVGQPEMEGKVIKVDEGDKIQILVNKKDTIIFHLSNIDCPENGQPYFEESKKFTENLCLNKKIKFCTKSTNEDGIAFGVIYLSKNESLNSRLLEEGLAWYFQKGLQVNIDSQTLSNIEEEAKTSKKGLWKTKNPVAPWVYKRNMSKYEAKSSI